MTDIASHRGGALLWPENSRIAFENTARLPLEQVEFDVHPSRDGKLVVIHDPLLDRTTDGTGPVCEHDWSELARLVLRGASGGRMLLLEEVIEIFRPSGLVMRLEIKSGHDGRPYDGLPAAVVATLKRQNILDRTVITSFQLDSVVAAGAAGIPRDRIWVVAPKVMQDIGGLPGVAALAERSGISMLAIRQNLLDAPAVEYVRSHQFRIGGWACNDRATILKMLGLGVDIFTTDRPDLAIDLRKALPA